MDFENLLLAKMPHLDFDDNKTYLWANLLNMSRKKFSWTLEKEEGDISKEEINMEDQVKTIEDWRPSLYVIKRVCCILGTCNNLPNTSIVS